MIGFPGRKLRKTYEEDGNNAEIPSRRIKIPSIS
jgi:hypothetical protein